MAIEDGLKRVCAGAELVKVVEQTPGREKLNDADY